MLSAALQEVAEEVTMCKEDKDGLLLSARGTRPITVNKSTVCNLGLLDLLAWPYPSRELVVILQEFKALSGRTEQFCRLGENTPSAPRLYG